MATTFTLTLDTTAPSGVALSIDGGAAFTTDQDVTAGVTSPDADTTQMKIWGDVDPAANASIQATEAASAWIAFSAAQAVRLSAGDGVKTLNVKTRDDVGNVSAAASDTITLDSTAPVPTITVAPDRTKISKIAGFNVTTFQWSSDTPFEEYKIKVVGAGSDPHTAGTVIGTGNGSTNMASAAGGFPAATNIASSINGADLEAASAGDGDKVIKVFVRDANGNWSV